MIVRETIDINGSEFNKSYSDSGKYILKVGTSEKYEEALDPIDIIREYVETDEDIPVIEEIETEQLVEIIPEME